MENSGAASTLTGTSGVSGFSTSSPFSVFLTIPHHSLSSKPQSPL